jgi:hypothetical protein
VTFADDLAALATELKVQQQLFEDNTFATTTADVYTNLATILDRGRKICKTEPTLQKLESSVRETIDHVIELMVDLADLVKNLAEVREGYVRPQGAGSVGPGIADLEAARKPHAEVRKKLKELAGDVETASKSVGRHGGAAGGSEQTNQKRPYRRAFTRIDGEYRRDLRRSG